MSNLSIEKALETWRFSTPPNVSKVLEIHNVKPVTLWPTFYHHHPDDQAFPGRRITVKLDGEIKTFIYLGGHIPELSKCAFCLKSELGQKIFGKPVGFVGILPKSKKVVEILHIGTEEEGTSILDAFLTASEDMSGVN